jgi:hypothetical protein
MFYLQEARTSTIFFCGTYKNNKSSNIQIAIRETWELQQSFLKYVIF